MTKNELQKIVRAFQPFLRFLAQTHHDEGWHDTRRQLLAQADQQIGAMVNEPAEKKPEKPSPKPTNKPKTRSRNALLDPPT